jgi:two-component system, OmpR family, sensor histidine kinase MprB
MTLRARLALSLAALAAVSVIAVAVVSYVATDDRLHGDVDAELVSYAARLRDPDGRVANMLCDTLQGGATQPSPTPQPGGNVGGTNPLVEFGGLLGGVPRGAVQCVDPAGNVSGWAGVVDLAVDKASVPQAASRRAGPLPVSAPSTEQANGTAYRVVWVPRPGGGEIRIARSLHETDETLGSLRDLSIAIGLAVIALAGAAGWFIARRTTRPVVRLTEAAEAVGATGRLGIDVPDAGRDEVGRLSRAFRSMLDALDRSRTQQQRLVQDAGHELRTPLTSLRANIDTLSRHPELAEGPRTKLLADLDSELRELSTLVDELVALAIDRYDDESPQRVRLDELATRAAERAERRSGRGVTVSAEPALVEARPAQLLRAVGNLLDNAAKFSPAGTPIELTVAPGRLVVRDHGPGISAADLPLVFERFHRAVEVRSLPGSGLGLAIVREAVEAAGGHVEAANHPDGGAVFTIELPVPPPA